MLTFTHTKLNAFDVNHFHNTLHMEHSLRWNEVKLMKASRKVLEPLNSFWCIRQRFSSGSAGNHQKTLPDLPAIVWNDYCNAILSNGKLSLCT